MDQADSNYSNSLNSSKISPISIDDQGRFFYDSRLFLNIGNYLSNDHFLLNENFKHKTNAITWEEDCLYVLISPIDPIISQALMLQLPESSRLVSIEFDTNLLYWYNSQLKTVIDKDESSNRVTINEHPSIMSAYKLLRSFINHDIKRIRFINLTRGKSLFKNKYDELEKTIQEEIYQFWQNQAALIQFGFRWFKNEIRNFIHLTKRNVVNHIPKGKPFLLCGAGPGLDSHISSIKDQQNSFIICAVDTAVPVLLAKGIRIDLIFMLESQQHNANDLLVPYESAVQVEELMKNCLLITDGSSYPSLTRQWQGKLICMHSEYTFPTIAHELSAIFKKETNFIPPLGSVGVFSLFILLKFSKENILCVGLDFSFYQGKSHANGSPNHIRHLVMQNRFCSPLLFYDSPQITSIMEDRTDHHYETSNLLDSYAAQTEKLCDQQKDFRVHFLQSNLRSMFGPSHENIHSFIEEVSRVKEIAEKQNYERITNFVLFQNSSKKIDTMKDWINKMDNEISHKIVQWNDFSPEKSSEELSGFIMKHKFLFQRYNSWFSKKHRWNKQNHRIFLLYLQSLKKELTKTKHLLEIVD